MIVNKTVKVNIKKNIFFPRSRGKVSSNPPHALLEEVRNIATEKEIIKNNEKLFLKILCDLSKRNAIENGHIIFNQHPA